MTMDTSVRIAGLRLKNPVLAASGTFGHGEEYSAHFDVNRLGGIVTKTISTTAAQVPQPCMAEYGKGSMLNTELWSEYPPEQYIEHEYAVAKQCQKIVCDDWETVKHRTQTLSRMYKDGELGDEDIYADLDVLVAGEKPGRQKDDERAYFNAVGLAFVDVAIAWALYQRAAAAGLGQTLTMQETTIFEHAGIGQCFRR